MFTETTVLTRSRSQENLIKTNVLSPAPIKNYSASILDEITGGDSSQDNSIFGNINTFAVRKHQSFGALNLEEQWIERLDKEREAELAKRGLVEESSSFSMEMPMRASNPIIYDTAFGASDSGRTNFRSFEVSEPKLQFLADALLL